MRWGAARHACEVPVIAALAIGCGNGGSSSTGAGTEDAQASTADGSEDAGSGSPSDAPSNAHDASGQSDGGPPTLRGHLAYVAHPTGGNAGISVAPLDGSSAPRTLTAGYSDLPRFSRDGAKVYYSNRVSAGREIRQIGVDGSNDHFVYGPCGVCYALGEDAAGRVLVWNENMTGPQGTLSILAAGSDGGTSLVPWPGDPGCTSDANLSTAGGAIVLTTICTPPLIALGDPAATAPLVGHTFSGVEVNAGPHVQTAGGRLYVRGWPPGTDAGPFSPVHIVSLGADGSDPRDLNVGDDAGDFVVADDASFVLVSHGPTLSDGGPLPLHSIVAHAGSWQMTIPGLNAIPSYTYIALAWTPH